MSGFEALGVLAVQVVSYLAHPIYHATGTALLGVLFSFSGLVKVRHAQKAAWMLVDFGVLRRPRPQVGYALGGAEVVLGFSLLAAPVPVASLFVTTTILWFFAYFLARQLARGNRAACFCFGDSEAPLTVFGPIRTGALALLASILLVTLPGAEVPGYAVNAANVLAAVALLSSALLFGQLRGLARPATHSLLEAAPR